MTVLAVTPVRSYLHFTGRTVHIIAFPAYTGAEPCVGDGNYTRDWSKVEQGREEYRETVEAMRHKCAACPLLDPCREYAVAHQFDVFQGGMTEYERKELARQRGQARIDPLYAKACAL